jgi:hypothetical protein
MFLQESNQTSNCTQTIAFFTDGVEGDTVAEDVFDRHNSKKKVSSRFGFIRYQIVQKQLND